MRVSVTVAGREMSGLDQIANLEQRVASAGEHMIERCGDIGEYLAGNAKVDGGQRPLRSAGFVTGARTEQRLNTAIDEAAIGGEHQPRSPFCNGNNTDKAGPLQRIANRHLSQAIQCG